MDNLTQKRMKKLRLNTVSSLLFQVTTIICGFVLPRFIIGQYGSEVNGIVNSITQFLAIVSFLDLGVGAVIQSAFYKPLADRNDNELSKIYSSGSKYFRTIAYILLVYIAFLIGAYPFFAKQNFSFLYIAGLIVAMSISSFAQFYFGILDRILLTADQRGYIQFIAQTITLIVNTIACVLLIKLGASIQVVKLTTSLIYLCRPLILHIYVNKHYNLDRNIKYTEEPIKQKWYGISQHIASVVLDNTDIIVLTVFDGMTDVSIYSVYHLIIFGLKQLVVSLTNGMQSLLGELWARNDKIELKNAFSWFEWLMHNGTILCFGCAGVLLIPFVRIYTNEISDVNYVQPLFGILLILAHASHCLRLPYNVLILAAGHYKETQSNYIVASLINITVSIITVKSWGLIGVALGTLIAMVYQTIWMALYDSKHLLDYSMKDFFKRVFVDGISVFVGIIATSWVKISELSFLSWSISAIVVGIIWILIILIINLVFYKEKVLSLINKVNRKYTHF